MSSHSRSFARSTRPMLYVLFLSSLSLQDLHDQSRPLLYIASHHLHGHARVPYPHLAVATSFYSISPPSFPISASLSFFTLSAPQNPTAVRIPHTLRMLSLFLSHSFVHPESRLPHFSQLCLLVCSSALLCLIRVIITVLTHARTHAHAALASVCVPLVLLC